VVTCTRPPSQVSSTTIQLLKFPKKSTQQRLSPDRTETGCVMFMRYHFMPSLSSCWLASSGAQRFVRQQLLENSNGAESLLTGHDLDQGVSTAMPNSVNGTNTLTLTPSTPHTMRITRARDTSPPRAQHAWQHACSMVPVTWTEITGSTCESTQ
jgi:hypothetical protein